MSLEQIRYVMVKEQELWKESDALREFAAVNHTAFFKIVKKHDKVVGRFASLVPPGTVNATLASSFMSHVEAQSFIRILHNENPLDERVVDQPELLKAYKDQLKGDLKAAYSLASGALTDILPHGMMTDQDKHDLQMELQDMYDSTVADVMSKIRMVVVHSTVLVA
jgi:SPX domain